MGRQNEYWWFQPLLGKKQQFLRNSRGVFYKAYNNLTGRGC